MLVKLQAIALLYDTHKKKKEGNKKILLKANWTTIKPICFVLVRHCMHIVTVPFCV